MLKHQILEAMKWQAPVEFAAKLSGLNKKMAVAAKTAKKDLQQSAKAEQYLAKRDEELDNAARLQISIDADLQQGHTAYDAALRNIGSLREQLKALSRAAIPTDPKAAAQVLEAIARSRYALSQSLNRQVDRMKHNAESLFQNSLQLQQRINGHLQNAQDLNGKLAAAIRSIQAKGPAGSAESGPNRYCRLLLHADDFAKIRTKQAVVLSRFGAFLNLIRGGAAEEATALTANNAYADASSAWIIGVKAQMNSRSAAERKRKADEQKQRDAASETLGKAKQALFPASCSQGDGEVYSRMQADAQRYYGRSTPLETVRRIPDSPGDYGVQSLSFLTSLLDMVTSSRDKLYVSEYLLDNFNYRTFEIDKKNGRLSVRSPADPGSHPLQNQEAEYVIYGFPGCHANLDAAYGEIYAVRFAVRLMESLRNAEVLAAESPLLAVLTAAALAAKAAFADCEQLLKGQRVPVSKYASGVKLSYRDYLLLFLFIHGGDNAKLSRIEALITADTGRDLAKTATAVSVGGVSRLNLLFWHIGNAKNNRAETEISDLHTIVYRIHQSVEAGY